MRKYGDVRVQMMSAQTRLTAQQRSSKSGYEAAELSDSAQDLTDVLQHSTSLRLPYITQPNYAA